MPVLEALQLLCEGRVKVPENLRVLPGAEHPLGAAIRDDSRGVRPNHEVLRPVEELVQGADDDRVEVNRGHPRADNLRHFRSEELKPPVAPAVFGQVIPHGHDPDPAVDSLRIISHAHKLVRELEVPVDAVDGDVDVARGVVGPRPPHRLALPLPEDDC